MRPGRGQPTRLHRPRDSAGKNTGVGCHILLQCMKGKRERELTQSCPTLGDPMDCSPPGSSVHGIFQSRVLKWGAIAFSDTVLYIRLYFHHQSHPQLSVVFTLSQLLHSFWSYFSTLLQYHIGHLPTWGGHLLMSYLFAFLYCSRGSKYSWGSRILSILGSMPLSEAPRHSQILQSGSSTILSMMVIATTPRRCLVPHLTHLLELPFQLPRTTSHPCISLLSLSIRGQPKRKPHMHKTNQTDHLDHSLV